MTFLVGDVDGTLRIVVVGVLAYVGLVAFLRISGKRTLSKMNAFDFVVTVALGSTLATILLSRDTPLLDGLVALAVLIGMQVAITWSSVRFRFVRRASRSEPRALLYRGRVLEGALRDERVLEEEVHAALRRHGLSGYEQADLVVLETDGSMAVVRAIEGPGTAVTGVRGVPEEGEQG